MANFSIQYSYLFSRSQFRKDSLLPIELGIDQIDDNIDVR